MSTVDLSPGTKLPTVEIAPVTRTMLALFAGFSGDHNPIHIDIDFAKKAGMDDVFAHGMVSMGYLARVAATWVPQERIRNLRGRFTSRTPVGGAPVVTGVVREHTVVNGERRAEIDVVVTLAGGPQTIVGTVTVALD